MIRSLCSLCAFAFVCIAACNSSAAEDSAKSAGSEEGFVSLFDGKTLDGWQGNKKGYVAKDGTIVCDPAGGGGNLYTEKEYGDFAFRFEFKLEEGANNGIGIRTPMQGDPAYVGMEIQVLDDSSDKYKGIQDYQRHGSVYGIIAAKRGHLKPVGEWNTEEIAISGSKIKVTLNGVTIVDGDLVEASTPKTLDGNNHPGLKNEKGYIAFCGHGTRVEFRNIRIKELK